MRNIYDDTMYEKILIPRCPSRLSLLPDDHHLELKLNAITATYAPPVWVLRGGTLLLY